MKRLYVILALVALSAMALAASPRSDYQAAANRLDTDQEVKRTVSDRTTVSNGYLVREVRSTAVAQDGTRSDFTARQVVRTSDGKLVSESMTDHVTLPDGRTVTARGNRDGLQYSSRKSARPQE